MIDGSLLTQSTKNKGMFRNSFLFLECILFSYLLNGLELLIDIVTLLN